MFTAAEIRELQIHAARHPFTDEANLQLPFAMLRADVKNVMRKDNFVDPFDLMPFYRKSEQQVSQEVKTVPYTKKHLKRIAKQLNRGRK